MIRDYAQGVHETLDITLLNVGSGKNALKSDSIFSNAFYDFTLYSDSAYTIPISSSAYESPTIDAYYTSSEIGFTDETIYSEYRVLDPTYQTGTIYARYESLGVYTSGAAVGQDYIIIDANYAYTTSPYAYMTYIVIENGLSADITITVTDGGGNERNKFKVINNDTVYSVWVKDSVTAAITWEIEPLKKELYYMDSSLKHGAGYGLVFNDQTNVIDVPTASVLGGIIIGSYIFENNNASTSSFSILMHLDQLAWNTQSGSTTAYNRYIQSTSSFGTGLGGEKIKKIWKLYD